MELFFLVLVEKTLLRFYDTILEIFLKYGLKYELLNFHLKLLKIEKANAQSYKKKVLEYRNYRKQNKIFEVSLYLTAHSQQKKLM